MAVLHNTPRHSRERDYIELWGKKTFKWTGTSLCHADSILAGYATSLIFIENILIFSHPLFFNSLLFCKRFDCVFSKLFFFPDRDPMRQVFGGKKLSVGPAFALSLGGLCQQPHKSLRAETCVAENWAEYSSGKFENRLVLKLSVCLWEIGIFLS